MGTLFKAFASGFYFRLEGEFNGHFPDTQTCLIHVAYTNPNTLLKLHKMNDVDSNISSALKISCILSKAIKLCK